MMFHQQAFTRAQIKITFAATWACIFSLTGSLGCKKDIGQDPTNNLLHAAIQERSEINPTVTNGMLHFDSFADLVAFTQSLQNKEADTAMIRSAYTALGINVDAETLPNLTDHPVCLLKEQSIGSYTSARKAEETVINAALDSGDDEVNSIVLFPFWKTALNADYAVHVGNRIYKYYDNGGIVIILNDDWTLYGTIKHLPYESVRETFNIIVTSDAREGWDSYFIFNNDESIDSEKSVFSPRFVATETTDGKLSIANISLIESKAGSSTYRWIYEDNTTSTGPNPTKAIAPGEGITLIINNGMGTVDTLSGVASILACSTENFTITYLSNNQIRFELPGFVPSNPNNLYDIRWIFSSDGSSSTNNPVVKVFSSNGNATCQLLHKNSGEIACQFTKPYFGKCGEKKSVSSSRVFNYCSQRWKLDGSIWVQPGEVGCRVKYLRWQGAILGWLPANNQAACADLSGIYRRTVSSNCVNITASGSKCLGAGTYPTSVAYTIPEINNVFCLPGQLSAALGINVCGVWHGWGHGSSPRLILQ